MKPFDELAQFQNALMNEIYFHDGGFGKFIADEKYLPNIGIYINNCRLILGNVLKDKYPYCAQIIGGDFQFYCDNFIRRFPLPLGDVTFYGAEFPEFIGQCDLGEITLLLADLAKLEWAQYIASTCAPETHLDLAGFSDAMAQNGGRNIAVSQSIAIIPTSTNALMLLQRLKHDELAEFVFTETSETIILWQGADFEINLFRDDGFLSELITQSQNHDINTALTQCLSETNNIATAQQNFAYVCANGLFVEI